MFRQARWNEKVIFELGRSGRRGCAIPKEEDEIKRAAGDVRTYLPEEMKRKTPPRLPELSEVEVVRHYIRLSQMNYGVDLGLYPLGSCTMKYNPKINEKLAQLPSFTMLHPYQDERTAQGILQILYTLSKWLAEITGTSKVCLHPAAGAQGEFLGTLLMRAYHEQKSELDKRTELIVPDSAHGTNPASGAMAGFNVVIVPSDETGCIDLEALKAVASKHTAGLMLTNPNTLGIFEKNIEQIANIVHEAGGLLYYDGANLNAILGKVRPGDMGFDIVHVNIHKTFGTPHGGGGPGAGPIGVSRELEAFLPVPQVAFNGEKYFLDYNQPKTIGKIRSFYGSIAVLLKAYAYILSLGAEGLKEAAEVSVLNANYLMRKLSKIKGYTVPYHLKQPRKHECVFTMKKIAKETGVHAVNVSKRILDYGVHSPTMYFPLTVDEAIMVEPTESYEKEELDRFIEIMKKISEETYVNPDVVLGAPRNTAISRLDESRASHPRTMVLSWCMYLKNAKRSDSRKLL
jgi:glycine dehydrogenase subunit 2